MIFDEIDAQDDCRRKSSYHKELVKDTFSQQGNGKRVASMDVKRGVSTSQFQHGALASSGTRVDRYKTKDVIGDERVTGLSLIHI